jgi:hypothetical protein
MSWRAIHQPPRALLKLLNLLNIADSLGLPLLKFC